MEFFKKMRFKVKLKFSLILVSVIILFSILLLLGLSLLNSGIVVCYYTVGMLTSLEGGYRVGSFCIIALLIITLLSKFAYQLTPNLFKMYVFNVAVGGFVGIGAGGVIDWITYRMEDRRTFKEKVAEEIKQFTPASSYFEYEKEYQLDLHGWLKKVFPSTEIEVTRSSSRPDIVVGDIAIEVKGPTDANDLATIADKAMRYMQEFSQIIVVLFNVEVAEKRYDDWYDGMKNQYSEVEIIRRDFGISEDKMELDE